MVSGLNQQQNRNIQYGANNAYNMQNSALNNNIAQPVAQNFNNNQNFGQLTAKNDTFENSANDPNFGAIDRQTLEQGAQEVQKQVESNPFTEMIKNFFGVDIHNPKKTLISLGLTLGTVLSLAKLGNSKFATEKLADTGIKVTEALNGNGIYTKCRDSINKAKDSVANFLRKSKTIDDVFDTFKNRKAKPVNQWAKGTGSGLKRVFSLTAPDTAKTALDKLGDDTKKLESIKKLVGESKAEEVFKFVTKEGADSVEVSNKLLHSIGENFGVIKMVDGKAVITDELGLQKILRQLKQGKITGLDGKLDIDVSEFTNIKMNNNKGPMKIISDWWPVNIIDDIGRKIKGDKWKPFGRANLGDALIKYSIISGQATSTKAGSFVQQLALFPSEAISNFGNDKSGLGFFLCGMIMNLYNNVQDAPKEKKAATMADDFMGTIGSLAITTPLACATMYGLSTLKNLKGTGFVSKYLLKPVGKFFGAGLDQKWKNVIANPSGSKVKDFFRKIPGRTAGFAGGALRFALIMFVFQGIFGKPLKNAVNKVFGKPYDPFEEEQAKQLQAQAANMEAAMKDLNLTEEQMVAKLQANPEFVTALQNDPQALQAIQNDPTLLLKLIAQLPDTPGGGTQNTNAAIQGNKFSTSAAAPSTLLNKHINSSNSATLNNQAITSQPSAENMQNTPNVTQKTQEIQSSEQNTQNSISNDNNNQQDKNSNEPVRTYIPSSKPFNYVEGDVNTIKSEEITNQNVQSMLLKADKAEQEAMKILG